MYSENQHLEFKQLWKDDHLKTICAFANGEGGRLLIGVDDNGAILGVDDAKSLLEILPNKINNKLALLVDVTENWQDGKNYIEISVQGTFALCLMRVNFISAVAATLLSCLAVI